MKKLIAILMMLAVFAGNNAHAFGYGQTQILLTANGGHKFDNTFGITADLAWLMPVPGEVNLFFLGVGPTFTVGPFTFIQEFGAAINWLPKDAFMTTTIVVVDLKYAFLLVLADVGFTTDGQTAFHGIYAVNIPIVNPLTLGVEAEQLDKNIAVGPVIKLNFGQMYVKTVLYFNDKEYKARLCVGFNF